MLVEFFLFLGRLLVDFFYFLDICIYCFITALFIKFEFIIPVLTIARRKNIKFSYRSSAAAHVNAIIIFNSQLCTRCTPIGKGTLHVERPRNGWHITASSATAFTISCVYYTGCFTKCVKSAKDRHSVHLHVCRVA